ncbi:MULTISPECIES: AraC family transcriptional regulator [Pseudomonas]|jgi:AraC-like DNA-binding protein|uniref:AraC family transcriptional regulator n=1 Tax=Pseudomonas TaxID=286 RepID=UPI000D014A9E|nr:MULTISPECIES: AraC family transcriptional regulator [Pseudomonas]MBI6917550.1 AraC family transcriptional regulator ligand-binding domain-containing protein [Pseudomonas monteilii]MCE0936454.1 AraC family transcriptional regulator [Pseudomonas kurunegalensis]MDR2316416.1 AraC family transcriptional regulator [Pseudomonas sp.]PRN03021.1 AraC family transcriptional regulator [Pseudomonas sp. LLC-1]
MKQAKNFAVHAGWKVIIADLGVAPGDLLALAELPADLFSRKDAVLSPPEYFRLFESLEQLVGESHLPLRLGGAISVEAFDPALFACLCSPDFNVALTRLAEYKRLCGPLALDVVFHDACTEVFIECYGYDRPLPRSLLAMELVFLTHLARLATRQTITPLEAELVALPEPAKPCEAFLGCSLRQGDCNRIRFSKEDASRPFLTENVSMWQFFEPELRTRLSKLEAGATTQERVHSALLDMLPSGRSSIQDVSSRLAMSKRSLQRHLADEALNYQEILNDTRQGLARHYLSRSNLSPGEIAFLIGFMDANSFLRAFKAWTGMTPGEYRRQHSYSM